MKLIEIVNFFDSKYPFSLQESWDNSGIQIGDYNADINKILIGVDLTEKLLNEGIEKGVDLIITHHPIIFRPLKSIIPVNPLGKKLFLLIKNNIASLALHTNVDSAFGGINDYISNFFDFLKSDVILPQCDKLYKIVVFVPKGHEKKVKDALTTAGAGVIGNYDYCFFSVEGVGNFRGNEGTNPFIGKSGVIESANEYRVETICRADCLNRAIEAMIEAHPYEEVAYDVYELNLPYVKGGIGRVIRLKKALKWESILEILSENDMYPMESFSNFDEYSKIAISSGTANLDIVKKAKNMGATLLICGELKYHDQLEAKELGISYIILGHYESEMVFIPIIKKALVEKFQGELLIV